MLTAPFGEILWNALIVSDSTPQAPLDYGIELLTHTSEAIPSPA
jgi:hypothetical protein